MIVIREMNNYGEPLLLTNGRPAAGYSLTFKLSPRGTFDSISHEKILSQNITVTLDSNGEFNVQLWPTERGMEKVEYYCSSTIPGFKSFYAKLPSGSSAIKFVEFKSGSASGAQADAVTINRHMQNASIHHKTINPAVIDKFGEAGGHLTYGGFPVAKLTTATPPAVGPTGLQAVAELYSGATASVVKARVRLSWTEAVDGYPLYDVSVNNEYYTTISGKEITFEDMTPGEYTFGVRFSDGLNSVSRWATKFLHVTGKVTLDTDVTGTSASWPGRDATVTWIKSADPTVIAYKIIVRSDATVLREVKEVHTSYTYTFGNMMDDTLGVPVATLSFDIYNIDSTELTNANPGTVTITHPQPDAPTAIAPVGVLQAIEVKHIHAWPPDTAKVELYAAPSNNRNLPAVKVGQFDTAAQMITIIVGIGETRYLWAKAFNIFGQDSVWYPEGAGAGIGAISQSDPTLLLKQLNADIDDTKLTKYLNRQLPFSSLIETMNMTVEPDVLEPGVVANLPETVFYLTRDVNSHVNSLNSLNNSVAAQANELSTLNNTVSGLITNDYDPATAYTSGQYVRSAGIVYECIADTTGHAPPNETYWRVATSVFQQITDTTNMVNILSENLAPNYVNTTTYSYGEYVREGADTYMFINATPSAGHTPPNITYWQLTQDLKVMSAYKFDHDKNVIDQTTTSLSQTANSINSKVNEISTEFQGGTVWSSIETYAIDTYVVYSNDLYKCTVAVTVSGTPPSTDTTHWVIQDRTGVGRMGIAESGIDQLGTITDIHGYAITGDLALLPEVGLVTYRAKSAVPAKIRPPNATYWDEVATNPASTPYQENKAYATGDYVVSGITVFNPSDIVGLDMRVSQAHIKVDSARGDILLAAERIDGLTGRVNQAFIDIDGANSAITLKAAQADFDSLGNLVGTQTGQIEILKDRASIKLDSNGNIAGMAIGWAAVPFNSGVAYITGNRVTASGITYEAIIDVPAGHAPPNATYWKVSIGDKSETIFRTDIFKVCLPDGTGTKDAFTIGTVAGVPSFGFNGNMIIDGSVAARSMDLTTLTVGNGTDPGTIAMGPGAVIQWAHLDTTAQTNLINGALRYTWIKYADDDTGTGITSNPSGKLYIGIAYNKTTSTASSTPGDYTWSLIKGTNGTNGQGQVKGVSFLRSVSAPATPTGGSFSTPNATGWNDGIPTDNNQPLWMTTRIFTSDGASPQQSAWTTPQKIGTPSTGSKVQFSVDGSTSWHDIPSTGDFYMRIGTSTDNGATWTYSGATKIKGETGNDGQSVEVQYSVNGSTSWHSTYVAGDMYLQQRVGTGSWSAAIKFVGTDGVSPTLPSYITSTKITATTIESPTISAGTFTGSQFILGDGTTYGKIETYDFANRSVGIQILDGATPSISVKGGSITGSMIQTSASGKRIVLDGSNELTLYDTDGTAVLVSLGSGAPTNWWGIGTSVGYFSDSTAGNSAIISRGSIGITAEGSEYGGIFGLMSKRTQVPAYGFSGTAPIVLCPSYSSAAPTHTARHGAVFLTYDCVMYVQRTYGGGNDWQKVGAQ